MSKNITHVLRVQNVHKHFTLHLRGGQILPVLHGVSLDVHAGECVALVGASGKGKSTLIKCLYGSYGVNSGRILFEREQGGEPLDLAQARPQEVLDLRRRELAYVSQFLRALPRVGALDVVAERLLQSGHQTDEAGWQAAQATARARVAELFTRLNLPQAIWDLPPATFSGGEQQRVNIARGFVQTARLLLLDEPTASLDAINRRVVIEMIAAAKAAGTAIVGIFHDEEVREAVATRCVSLPAAQLEVTTP